MGPGVLALSSDVTVAIFGTLGLVLSTLITAFGTVLVTRINRVNAHAEATTASVGVLNGEQVSLQDRLRSLEDKFIDQQTAAELNGRLEHLSAVIGEPRPEDAAIPLIPYLHDAVHKMRGLTGAMVAAVELVHKPPAPAPEQET